MAADTADTLVLPVGRRDHIDGSAAAKVTLVEYGDYECPHCGAAYPILKEVRRRLGSRLRFVFRNFPLADSHPHALHAAEAAEAAGAQGKFWQMHDMLFEHQRKLLDRYLVEYAGSIGLDAKRFREDLTSHAYAARVQEDLTSGADSGVRGTPSFFINGQRYRDSWDEETLTEALTSIASRR